jgi:hypothetical protein
MGFFKKVFKGIGKVFKKVGKFIKKGFQKLGKFVNKLGVIGQIGMMFITGGLANMAFAGLQSLGSGFMQGLASYTGAGAGVAKTAHAILSGASQIAQLPVKGINQITKNVVGAVTDTVKFVGEKFNLGKGAPIVDPKTGGPLKINGEIQYSENISDIAKNISKRFKVGFKEIKTPALEAARILREGMPGGTPYQPKYVKFVHPDTGQKVTKEINYSSTNKTLYDKSLTAQEKVASERATQQAELTEQVDDNVSRTLSQDAEGLPTSSQVAEDPASYLEEIDKRQRSLLELPPEEGQEVFTPETWLEDTPWQAAAKEGEEYFTSANLWENMKSGLTTQVAGQLTQEEIEQPWRGTGSPIVPSRSGEYAAMYKGMADAPLPEFATGSPDQYREYMAQVNSIFPEDNELFMGAQNTFLDWNTSKQQAAQPGLGSYMSTSGFEQYG